MLRAWADSRSSSFHAATPAIAPAPAPSPPRRATAPACSSLSAAQALSGPPGRRSTYPLTSRHSPSTALSSSTTCSSGAQLPTLTAALLAPLLLLLLLLLLVRSTSTPSSDTLRCRKLVSASCSSNLRERKPPTRLVSSCSTALAASTCGVSASTVRPSSCARWSPSPASPLPANHAPPLSSRWPSASPESLRSMSSAAFSMYACRPPPTSTSAPGDEILRRKGGVVCGVVSGPAPSRSSRRDLADTASSELQM
ncbi:hypothetical protein B484DRAFT_442555 [Ochromonadaceae sp. CCMP2298]|nr:hypothetical protein B484DRAFT_442555 [Ochromonadaceae sp. CCMP2298]